MNPLCIYHGNCADGFAAAWAVRRYFGEGRVDFHAGTYGTAPPDVTGRSVILVDFSYKRPVLEKMLATASNILILDHHKTAAEDLGGLPEPCPWECHVRAGHDDIAAYGGPRMAAMFDMKRSGAMITWDYFFPADPQPQLFDYVQDRDLWIFKLGGSRDVHACLVSYPWDFAVWDKLMQIPLRILMVEGEAIERRQAKDVEELVGVTKRRMRIGGYDVPVANLPYTLASDAGHLMARGEAFAATYMDQPTGRVFSLRSSKIGGVDVSEIAKSYGGGGHFNAAGFTAVIGWEGDVQQ